MTPHLHPRSRLTTSLFGTTLLISFLVVGMPHIIPCPAPRVKFADGEFEITEDGKRRRRRRPAIAPNMLGSSREDESVSSPETSEEEKLMMRRNSHECPVPKPRGFIGEVLGFGKEDTAKKLPRTRVETTKVPRSRSEAE